MSKVPVLHASDAGLIPFSHGFLTREGGVSDGPWCSLNCDPRSGDDPDKVEENRSIALAAIDADNAQLATPIQHHGPIAAMANGKSGFSPRADALVAARPGVAVGVLTADCAPILLADPEAKVVGATHAGWRGALAGIIGATVDAMCKLGAQPKRISTAIGPSIGRKNYEVDPAFCEPFIKKHPTTKLLFRPAGAKLLFDLPAFVRERLEAADIGSIEHLDLDTVSDRERFFSYRRNFSEGEKRYGRMLSLIVVPSP